MRRLASACAVIPIVALAGCIAFASEPALAGTPRCGDTISADTTLHSDLSSCAGDGLVIGADNITLDLNGHTIDGDAIAGTDRPDDGISNHGHSGVTIENGTVQEFDHGVGLDGASRNRLRGLTTIRNSGRAIKVDNGSSSNRIEDNTSSNNGRSGIALLSSNYNVVENNTLSGNVVAGMGGFTVHHTLVRSNVVSNNGDNGIYWDAGSDDNRIEENAISGSPSFGLAVAGARNIVSRNHLHRNCVGIPVSGEDNAIVANLVTDAIPGADFACGTGIVDEGGTRNLIALNRVARTLIEGIRVNAYEPDTTPAIGIVIRDNLVRDAGTDGIGVASDPGNVGTVKDTVVTSNVVIGSGHDGINVATAATTLTRNLALRAGNLGIEAVPGVTDGGGNHAIATGNPARCTNVAC